MPIANDIIEKIENKHNIKFNLKYGKYYNLIIKLFTTDIDTYTDIITDNDIATDGYINNILGLYYKFVKINNEKMLFHFMKGACLNNANAMCNLGDYYSNTNEIEKMKYYYEMAISLNDLVSMRKIALYYKKVEDYSKMKYYFELAIRYDCEAMVSYALYFKNVEKDYAKMISLYDIAAFLNNRVALNNYGHYYMTKCKDNIDHDYIKNYFVAAASHGSVAGMLNLGYYYTYVSPNVDKMKYYLEMGISLGDADEEEESMYKMGISLGDVDEEEESMYKMGADYVKNYNYNYNSIKYYIELAIFNNNKWTIDMLNMLHHLDQYLLLKQLEKKNINNKYITKNIINKINNYDICIKYINKCNELIKKKTCMICFDDNANCIPLDCAHYVCINSDEYNCYSRLIYSKNGKCPQCNTIIFVSID